MGGFESACHINSRGQRLNLVQMTQHDTQIAEDYKRLQRIGICVARDGIGWPYIEQRAGQYDFSTLAPMVEAARDQGIQVIWNLCHYGWPDDVDVFSPAFVDRFARFCTAVTRFIRTYSDDVPFFVPINEISFVVYAVCEAGFMYPHTRSRAGELKRQLIRAAIAGMEAVWAVDARARFAHAEPLVHILAPRDRPDLIPAAAVRREAQFEAWDMLSGYRDADLGGDPRYLDIVGVNFYHSNEWELPGNRLRWEDTPRDDRWIPFHQLLAEVYERYNRPLFIAETSHFGAGRAAWLREIAEEVQQALFNGVPLQGVCIYPIIDRPDWEAVEQWHHSGLWNLVPDEHGNLQRVIEPEYAEAVREAQQLVNLMPEPM